MRNLSAFARAHLRAAAVVLLGLGLVWSSSATAADTHIDVRHIIPPFNPALDAVHAPTGFGTGKIWHVGPTERYKTPSQVAPLVHNGDIVEIDAATYKCDQSVRWTSNDLTLVGVGGRPVLDATGCDITGGKGIWNPSGNNLIVDNIAFVGARVGSANGAGIRYDGTGYLYITNSYFHNNEDGILYTPNFRFNATNNVVIDHSEFNHNGYPSGQAHNMYINECHSFVLRFSYSHNAIIGHDVKSRADENFILYNRIADEADGTASYNIDLPNGGLSYIIGNIIQKSPHADNPSSIAYSEETPRDPIQKLYVAYNTIVNESSHVQYRHVLFINDKGLTEARLIDNVIVGVPASSLFTGSGAPKVQVSGNVITDRPGFYDAKDRIYFLTKDSPAVNKAIPAGDGDGFPLTPKYQFVFPVGGEPRPIVGPRDVGAYEYVPGQKIAPAPTVKLSAARTPIDYDGMAHLSWTTSNATHCDASGGWSGERPVSGQYTSQKLTSNTDFGLACAGPSGITHASVTVTVNDSPRAAALGIYHWKQIPNSAFAPLCPPRQQYPDLFGTGDCDVKQAYATGVYVPPTQRWYLLGGGGTRQYYGNEVYALDLSDMRPQRVTNPTHISDSKEYAPHDLYGSKIHMKSCDGILHMLNGGIAPAPRGILGQAAYDPRTKTIVVGPWAVIHGIGNCNGSTLGSYATDQWSFDPFTNEWKLLAGADEHFGSTIESTWILDPQTGIAYNGDGSRVGKTRGAWLINYNKTPPQAFLVDDKWPYDYSIGPVAVDTTHQYALQLVRDADGRPPEVVVYNLRHLMSLYRAGQAHQAAASTADYRPDTSWKITGNTTILQSRTPGLTYNPKLGMFVAWSGGDHVYFMQPDYDTKTLNIFSKQVVGAPFARTGYILAGGFTYLPDHDAYLVFAGMRKDFSLLLPPGSSLR